MHFLLPCMLAVYLGIILQGYSVKEFNGLITNRYFLLGKQREGKGGREGGREGERDGRAATRVHQEGRLNPVITHLPLPPFPPSLRLR
jgi:hypothetical protein